MANFILQGTMVSEQPLATCSKDLFDREGEKNKPIPVPSINTALGKRLMYPATGLRGKLRRSARDVVRKAVEKLTGNDKPFSLDEHYLLTLGGIKGEGAQDRSSVAHEAEWRIKNPLLSLFGAGDAGFLSFVQGRLGVGNAICNEICDPVIFPGARTDDLYRDKSQIAYLSDADVSMLISRAKGGKSQSDVKAQIKALDADFKKARKAGDADKVADIESKIEALNAAKVSIKETTGTDDVSIGMPLAGWQAIPPGQVMDQKMFLMRSNQIELGLLLKSLGEVAQAPFVGAHYANGCGMISGQWDVFEATETEKRLVGTVKLQPFEPLELSTDELRSAVGAFNTFMDSMAWNFSVPSQS